MWRLEWPLMRPYLLLPLLLLVASCVGGGAVNSRSEQGIFVLDLPTTTATRDQPLLSCRTLLVSMVQSAPGYATSNMAYMQEPYRIDYFANHRWADTPAQMLAPLLVRSLERSRLVGGVVMAPNPVNADLRLDTKVLSFRQSFVKHNGTLFEVVLDITLLDVVSGKLLGSRTLTITRQHPERSPYGGVVAANEAIALLLTELTTILEGWLDGSEMACR